MNNVVDEVLAGSPKYTLTYSDNSTATGVSIDLETQVTTAGTPLNKALFDSIKSDLNSRLLISNKATTGEAEAGTDDSHYMTPLKVKAQLQYLTKTGSVTSSSTTMTEYDVFKASDIPAGVKRVIITGKFVGNNNPNMMCYLYINGTDFHATEMYNQSTYTAITSATQIGTQYYKHDYNQGFKIELDLSTNILTYLMQFSTNATGQQTYQLKTGVSPFTTFTSLTAKLQTYNTTTSSVNYTATYIY